jgi:hypothetical protein
MSLGVVTGNGNGQIELQLGTDQRERIGWKWAKGTQAARFAFGPLDHPFNPLSPRRGQPCLPVNHNSIPAGCSWLVESFSQRECHTHGATLSMRPPPPGLPWL